MPPTAPRQDFADHLAHTFQQLAATHEENVNESNVSNDDEGKAQITFLRRTMCRWFMTSLQSKDGGAMRKGLANEDRIIKSLAKYVFEYSHGKYKVKHIWTYGLLVW